MALQRGIASLPSKEYMLEDSLLRSGNLEKANNIESYQRAYERSLAKDGHFNVAPEYYEYASHIWAKHLHSDPLNFRKYKIQIGTNDAKVVPV